LPLFTEGPRRGILGLQVAPPLGLYIGASVIASAIERRYVYLRGPPLVAEEPIAPVRYAQDLPMARSCGR
jgi:hypothetical protein